MVNGEWLALSVYETKVLRRYLRKMVPTENVPFGSAQGTFSSWLSGVETNGTGTFICGDRLSSASLHTIKVL